jgi:thiamine pyrophosphate-dependent acetolactate synthase large subunit-like protein
MTEEDYAAIAALANAMIAFMPCLASMGQQAMAMRQNARFRGCGWHFPNYAAILSRWN